ncbi:MAG: hypothetical protein JW797_16420 [Bradymonadales bacterium]|nr:hypothetical protein [Bradymonadales bacterium]
MAIAVKKGRVKFGVFISLCGLWLLVTSCSDARLTHNADSDDGSIRERPAYNPTSDAGTDSENDGEPVGPRDYVLLPAQGNTDLIVGYESSQELGVYLYSLADGQPVPDALINWLMEGDGSGNAQLNARNTYTDTYGLASVRFNAGNVPTEYSVTASYPGANNVVYQLTVMDLPVGSLEVTVRHPSASIYDVSPINVRIFPRQELQCSFLSPGMWPAEYFAQVDIANTSETARFDNLLAGDAFTIVATGFGAIGEIAAQACQDDVFIEENVTRNIEMVLQLLPLNPVGQYDAQSWWDLRQALLETGSVGSIIMDILDLFENPGEQILDYMLDALGYFVGGWVEDVVEVFIDLTGLDDLIAGWINDLINQSETLREFFSIGCDLRRMVTRLQILSVLDIGKLGSNFEVFGVDTWVGLGICDFTPNPDFQVGECDNTDDCERIAIVIDNRELGLLRGDWQGRVLSYNHLQIDLHAIDFNYGRLILFVLEQYIFPLLVDEEPPVSLEDVFADIIDCAGLAEWVTGSDGEICVIGCVTDDQIEGFCNSAIELVFGTFFESFVSALSFDSVMQMRGDVTLVNDDTDLDVERLTDGEYVGNITVNDRSTPFTATFVGQRRE